MSHVRGWAVGVAVGVVVLAANSAVAGPPAARLVYSRAAEAESCPDEEALRRAVAARVGYDAFFPWAKRTVVAGVDRREGAFVASVDLIDERGIRHGGHELRAEGSCGDLLDAVALAVAIAIDPQLLLAQQPAPSPPAATAAPPAPAPVAPDPAPTVLPTPAPAPAPAPDPALARPAASPVTIEGSLGPTVAAGFAPGASLGGTVGVEAHWSRFSLGLEGFMAARSSQAASTGGSVSAWPLVGALVPCVHVGPVFGCALAQSGALFGSGEQVPGARSSSGTWVAFGARVGAELRLRESLALRLRLDGLFDVTQPALWVGTTPEWSTSLLAGSAGIDAVVRFR